MVSRTAYFWKKTPFIRILLPFIAGIIIQWYGQVPPVFAALLLAFSFATIIVFFFISFFSRYKMSWLSGLGLNILFIAAGALLTSNHDIRNNGKWFGRFYEEKTSMVITTDEPLVEKTKSFKANASVNCIIKNKEIIKVTGKIILYFKKDSLPPRIDYGSQIILNKPLQEIKNSGNPGGFDYKRYSLFQGITHQIYLKPGEFQLLEEKNTTLYQQLFYPVRKKVLNIIRTNIRGDKETGLAEALLIGYKNDLDKTLVQSYTNTGVVHIIAISGLHIGLIYWLLVQLLRPLQKRKYSKWLQPILIIAGLWAFSLLAGGQASVLRSALMFTGIVLGQAVGRKYSVYNTMALSALILLCYNPYWLWDVGFQLSYTAVLSIMIFMKPVYNWFYVKNKI
ncbi:MAG TPA: ComEC/Rec2 family competence protein, partial [Chitinophagaceae bacterium]|nr:ComEC/Rec2 family competence protein [Chitinophagaceae bacterium]